MALALKIPFYVALVAGIVLTMRIYMSGFMGYYVSPLYKNYRIILPGAMAIAILMYIIKRGLI